MTVRSRYGDCVHMWCSLITAFVACASARSLSALGRDNIKMRCRMPCSQLLLPVLLRVLCRLLDVTMLTSDVECFA